jgi:hypothetical protein
MDKQAESFLKIADIHVKTLQATLDDLRDKYPFTEGFVINMQTSDLRTLETMNSRFGKLQDLMGTKIIDLYLISESQPIEGLSMLDKIHKLEKFNIIDDEDIWSQLRRVRNNISHEYPDAPELAARQLNHVYRLAPALIAIYQKLAQSIRAA